MSIIFDYLSECEVTESNLSSARLVNDLGSLHTFFLE